MEQRAFHGEERRDVETVERVVVVHDDLDRCCRHQAAN